MNLVVNEKFGSIWYEQRKDGSIWFSAKDVCDSLGYSNSRDALVKHVPTGHSDVANRDIRSENGVNQKREIQIIDEAGLYMLILRSRLEKAAEFTEWVTAEVLPSIRKTGRYETKQLQKAEAKEAQKATGELLKEMNKYLTYTDTRQVARKLNVTDMNVNRVMSGAVKDVAIFAELFDRMTRNRKLHAMFFTTEGVEKLMGRA
jgi:prophage antirepressor-like protein